MIDTHVDGDVEAIRGNADWLRQTLKKNLEEAGDDALSARSVSDSVWEGKDQVAYSNFARTLVGVTDDHARRTGRAAQAYDDYAAWLHRMQHRMGQLRGDARDGGLILAGEEIQEPPAAEAVPDLPAGSTPEQKDAHDQKMAAHDAAVKKIELYQRIDDAVSDAWENLISYVDGDLTDAVADAQEGDDVDSLKKFVEDNHLNFIAGGSLTFFDKRLSQRARDFRARADELRAARRSGNPERRARGRAPGAAKQVGRWRKTARGLSKFSKVLGPVGVAVDIAFGLWDVAHGGSPGRATVTTVASIGGGALVVAGAAALAATGVLAAPALVVGLAAAGVAVGAGWAAGKAWDALPDDFTDGVDDTMSDAYEGTKKAVSEGWDKVKGWF